MEIEAAGSRTRPRRPAPARFLVIKTPVSAAPASGAGGAGPTASRLRGRGVLGDGLGALGHGVLGELAGEREAHGGLDLARGEGALLVVAHELAGLVGDLVEDVGDEGVHDRHALGRDARVGVHLLEHLVDVDGVGLAPLLLALPALGALTLKLLDLLFVRLGGHAAAEGLLPGEEGGVSSCDFVSAAALGGMPPPGPKAFFLDESSAPFQIKLRLSRTQVRARLALRQPANSRKSLEIQAARLALRKSRQICCVTSSLQLRLK